ncbi:UMP kinase [Nanoarchaeota archaeon]
MRTIIISLGGSLIVPAKVDINFLNNFKRTILSHLRTNRFIIYCGGGRLARDYQAALSDITKAPQEALDWIGIHATMVNASFVQKLFGDLSDETIIIDPTKKIKSKKKIILAAGWKPGWSTDYDAVLVAKQLKVKEMINMSNVDTIYDKDPKKFKNVKAIKEISWKNLRKIVGSEWSPGLNMPFDPIAAKEAEKIGLKVYVIGKDLNNLTRVITRRTFKGTLVY